MTDFRPAALIPTYDNARTLRAVVEALRRRLPEVIVVDDGSGVETQEVVAALAAEGLIQTTRHAQNRGKGGAVKTGFALARELGFTHVLQVDADGQHQLDDVPRFLEVARQHPRSLVLGHPVFDASVPRGRLIGRQLTIFWTRIETGGRQIVDPMCGFRVYPLAATEGLRAGDRMDFDIEVAVKLVWRGVPVINLPTQVKYPEGGVSHFRMFKDNLLISWMHTRLVVGAALRLLSWPVRAFLPARSR